MWYLVSNLLETEIIEGEIRPKMHSEGGKWTYCSCGYETKESLIANEHVSDKPCRSCGQIVYGNFTEPLQTHLLTSNICFSCNFWEEKIELVKKPDSKIVIANHRMYVIGDEDSKSYFRGFGGAKFTFVKDGDIIESTNVWFNGEIPKLFWDRLPDNATLL